MANNYLDKNGLLYLWQKITSKFVAKEAGKGLSTNDYTTPEKDKLGGMQNIKQIGAGLSLDAESGTLSATGGGTADAVEWANVQNKPTTLAGYGITDAASADHNHDSQYLKLSGGTMTGPIQFSADQGQIAKDTETATAKIEMDAAAAEILFTDKTSTKTNRMTVSATGAVIAVGEATPGDGTGIQVTIDGTNGVKIPMVADPVNDRDAAHKKFVMDSLAPKANTADVYKKTEVYSKTEIDEKGFLTEHQDISGKADKSTTLAGYGITDAYTKTETEGKIDEKIAGKANSADVYTKAETYTKTETDTKIDEKILNKADKATTLAGYGITDAYTKEETYSKGEVDGKLSSVYKPAGNCLFANLPQPSASNLGNVYSMMDAFTTDDRFVASEPTQYPIGTNVAVVQVQVEEETKYLFDVLAGFVDLSGYMQKTDMVAITNQEIDQIVGDAVA